MKDNIFREGRENKEQLQPVLFFGIGVGLLIYSLHNHTIARVDWMMSPYLFPLLISMFFILLSVALFREIRAGRKTKDKSESKKAQNDKLIKSNVRTLELSIMVIFLYYLAMPYIGFLLSGFVFLPAMFWLLGEKKLWVIGLLSLATPVVLYGLFHNLLHVMLP